MATSHQTNKQLWRRYIDNLYLKDDIKKISESVHSDTDSFDEVSSQVWKDSASVHTEPSDRDTYYSEARRLLLHLEHSKRLLWRRIAVSAVSVAAIVCIVVIGFRYYDNSRKMATPVNYLTTVTSFGEKKSITLPDGTKAILNSCTMLRYPDKFAGKQRVIELDGEAYFSVFHNAQCPFVVRTKRMNVKVLGTKFNLKSYQSDQMISVDVDQGKVQVDLADAMMRIAAHQQIVVNTATGDYTKRRDTFDAGVWRSGTLRFECTPIQDVAKELERVYGCHISFSNDSFDNLISGEHDNKSLTSVLNSIHFITGGEIKYKCQGKEIMLYK
jgi:ferric-dicitrate binding protein FerR (iron transport regulator)